MVEQAGLLVTVGVCTIRRPAELQLTITPSRFRLIDDGKIEYKCDCAHWYRL